MMANRESVAKTGIKQNDHPLIVSPAPATYFNFSPQSANAEHHITTGSGLWMQALAAGWPPRTGIALPAGHDSTKEELGKGREVNLSNHSLECVVTPHCVCCLQWLSSCLFLSVEFRLKAFCHLLVRVLLLTAWLPHHSLLPPEILVSWLAASVCAQLMYLWAQDRVNQRAQSSFRWAAEVKH